MSTIETLTSKAAIAGTITDMVTGLPIAGAAVVVAGVATHRVTRDDGFYFFVDVPDGSYSLTVTVPLLGSRYAGVSVSGVLVSSDSLGKPVFDTKATIALSSTRVQGTIRRAVGGLPIAGAIIRAIGSEATTTSASDGSFTLSGLYAGEPNIQASAAGYVALTQKAVLHAGIVTAMNFNLTTV